MKRFTPVTGFSLGEVVISGALVSLTIGALFAATSMAIRLSSGAQQRLIASQLAREGIEAVRSIRDSNFIDTPRTWTHNILDNTQVLPMAPSTVIAKHLDTSGNDLRLVTVETDTSTFCTDYLVRDTTPGAGGIQQTSVLPSTPNSELYCRRITIEPVSPQLGTSALRVRSQVAWLGDGKNQLRTLDAVRLSPGCPTKGVTPDSIATEWCSEQVILLTDWRSGL